MPRAVSIKISFAMAALLLIPAVALSTMPPKPGLYDMETGKSVTTGDPYPEFPDHFGQPIGSAKSSVDVTGIGKMAVVLVDFPDRQADYDAHPQSLYQSLVFSVDEYPTGSLNEFFIENSYGLYSVEGSAYGWNTTSQQYSYFDDGNYGLSYGGQLVAGAAAELTDPYVDYGTYDSDGPDGIPNSGDDDGYVDAFTVIHSGLGAEESGSVHDIWSHAWSIDYTTNDFRAGGGYIRIASYSIQPEERLNADGDTLVTGISVICHEYGHILGLPDLYDGSRYTWGIGYWGLMGYGAWGAGGNTPESPAHLCAWSKVTLGWIDPVNVGENVFSVEIPAVEADPVAYTIWRNGSPGVEYFLIENRQQLGFDTPAPGHGLLIWHYNNNGGPYHNRLELEQADGLNELDDGDGQRPDPHYYHDFMGDDGDPFPGSTDNTMFGPDTNPSSDADNGTSTDVIIGNITEIGNTILADLVIDPESYLLPPTDLETGFGCETIVLKWRSPDSEDQLPDEYSVYRKVGDDDWEILATQPATDSSFVDDEIIFDMEILYGVSALYGEQESPLVIGDPIYIPDITLAGALIVGDSSSEDLNLWYRSILDSLGVQTVMVDDILPYCGEMLADLPALWIVSFPGEYGPLQDPDRETAITDYLDRGGRLFIHDGTITFSEIIYNDYLQYDYTTCTRPGFVHVDGIPGTFAEGLAFDFPDSVAPSYMCPMGDPSEVKILLDDPYGCSSVAIVVDRLGFKAVVNSQPLHELLDGPDGTRLELFNRMLNFFDIQTSLDGDDNPVPPVDFILLSAYPNPFNSEVKFHASLDVSGSNKAIEIHDIAGRLVRKLPLLGSEVIWDGRTEGGAAAASGIYFARLTGHDGFVPPIKLTLLK